MSIFLYFISLFIAKVLDNMLSTAKTILVQRNKCIMAGIALAALNFIYFCITKNIVMDSNNNSLLVVSIASGVGCCFAVMINDVFSKDKTYINVVMSDDLEPMKDFRDFLAKYHITNIASDSYTLDWHKKTISITAYADTKNQSRFIDSYLSSQNMKFKRRIYK